MKNSITKEKQQTIKYLRLIRQWKNYKLTYDFFTLPEDKKPCKHLHASFGGFVCSQMEGCEFRKYDSTTPVPKEDEFYSSLPFCSKLYSLDDSQIRGKTVNDLEELETIVNEMRKQETAVRVRAIISS